MNGKTMVVGLLIFVILVVGIIYFAMTAQFDKDENREIETETIVN